MLRRSREKVLEELIAHFKSNPSQLWEILEDHILNDPNLIKRFEAKFDKAKATRMTNELNRRLDSLDSKEIEMEGSTEPWFSYVVVGYDSVQGWKTKLAWNSAFIKQAKEAGIQGTTENDIVEKYLLYTQYDPLMDANDFN